jgi:hypothetical protein
MRLAGPWIMRGRGLTIGRIFLLSIAALCIIAALPAAEAGVRRGKVLGSDVRVNARLGSADVKPVRLGSGSLAALLDLAENETEYDEDDIFNASNITALEEAQREADELIGNVENDVDLSVLRQAKVDKKYLAAVDLTKTNLEDVGESVEQVMKRSRNVIYTHVQVAFVSCQVDAFICPQLPF